MAHPSQQGTSNGSSSPIDRLTTLPPELTHLICDFLLPTHEPDIAFEDILKEKSIGTSHALDHLAATRHTLRAQVNSWAHHFLRQHAAITHYKGPKPSKKKPKSLENNLRGRRGLLTWTETHCIFCGKKSNRSAILANGLRCCSACDREQWPDKITKTAAKKDYDLKDHHLLPHQHQHPSPLLARHPAKNLPCLRYGTYISSNVPTTMFLSSDVLALANHVHGDFVAHKRRKEREAEERKRRKVAKAEKTEVLDRAWAEHNKSFQSGRKEKKGEVAAVVFAELLAKEGEEGEVPIEGGYLPLWVRKEVV